MDKYWKVNKSSKIIFLQKIRKKVLQESTQSILKLYYCVLTAQQFLLFDVIFALTWFVIYQKLPYVTGTNNTVSVCYFGKSH